MNPVRPDESARGVGLRLESDLAEAARGPGPGFLAGGPARRLWRAVRVLVGRRRAARNATASAACEKRALRLAAGRTELGRPVRRRRRATLAVSVAHSLSKIH